MLSRRLAEGIGALQERLPGKDNRGYAEGGAGVVETRALPDVGVPAEKTGEVTGPERHTGVASVWFSRVCGTYFFPSSLFFSNNLRSSLRLAQ